VGAGRPPAAGWDVGRVAEDSPPTEGRRARMLKAARARGIPLPTILATVAVVVVVYLLANLVYRLRDVILLIVVAGFIALLLNPPGGAPPAPGTPPPPGAPAPLP